MENAKITGYLLIIGGVVLTLIVVAIYIEGWIWPWATVLGPTMIIIGILMVVTSRKTVLDREYLDPNYDKRPFLMATDAFGKRLEKLQQRAPQLLTSGMAERLKRIHYDMVTGATHEETIYEDDAGKIELLRIKIAKLENGKTSLVFRGRTELMAMLDKQA